MPFEYQKYPKHKITKISTPYSLHRTVMGELVKREVGSMVGELTPHSMQLLAPSALQRLLDSGEWQVRLSNN